MDYTDPSGYGGDQVEETINLTPPSRFSPTAITWCLALIGARKGAVTWGSEASGVTGTVSAASSLVGSMDYTDPSGDGRRSGGRLLLW